ncbi:hypothetical protein WH47_10692 [Habropoda laboriosa]|uniref:MADF domain-containing protein n=1 Tax=Habropoda laboriosa TaxID=597456 RepID=A0A0L7RBW8_9HYME|nr:hypothetical protein WH47_10692 [Habropoda laboriosa]
MSSKWNERLVINFIIAYKQHPCLWNPYHKDYRNCREKNEALQKIIDDLGIPGFTVTDYLHQIKTIREKYKQEQTRTIKSLQSQKQYKSPFGWYNIVADMLTKVINDEEKCKYRETTSVPRSLSSDDINNSEKREKTETEAKSLNIRFRNDATSNLASRRSKSVEESFRFGGKRSSPEKVILKEKNNKKVRYVPCSQFRAKEGGSKDRQEETTSNYKHTRDTDSAVIEYPAATPSTSIDSRSNPPSLTRKNGKSYEPPFLKCPSCGWEDIKYEGIERNGERNVSSCCGYSKHFPGIMNTPCIGCDRVTRDDMPHRPEYSKKYVHNSGDFQVLRDLSENVLHTDLSKKLPTMTPIKLPVESIEKHVDVGVQHSENSAKIVQIDPLIANKLQCGTIEASTQLKIILPESTKNLKLNVPVTENIFSTKSTAQEAQHPLESEKNEVGVNTVNYIEKEVENTVCVSNGAKKCVSIQTVDQSDKQEKGKDKHYKRNATESKKVAVNMVDQVSKGTQSAIYVSRGNLACRMSAEKMIEIGTSMSVHKVRTVGCVTTENVKELRSNFVQCVLNERYLPLTRIKSHESIKRCVWDTDSKHSVHEEVQQLESPCTTDTCSLNILTLIKEDPTVACILQKLLHSILFKREHGSQSTKPNGQTDYECKNYLKESCLIDAAAMVKGIKEYMMKTLESSITENNVKEFYQKFDARSSLKEVEGGPSFAEVYTSSFRDSKLTMTEESILKPEFESTTMEENEGQKISKNDKVTFEKAKRKFPVVDKEVSTHMSYKDVGTNGSSTQLSNSDMENLTNLRYAKDSVSLAKSQQRAKEGLSVGTQKRDPILVRVIKCNESQGIVKLDKETLTLASDVDFVKKYVNKRIETCGRSTCIPPTVCRKLNENQLVNNYCIRSVVCKDICDKNCKAKESYDLTDVTNIDVPSDITYSKIPLCMKPRKYMYARSN